MKIIKRDGRKVDYDSDKIIIAISKANKEVGGKDKMSRESIEFITKYIESLNKPTMSVEDIQDIIEKKLMEFGKFTLAKKYILYRDKHAMIRKSNSTDEKILSLIKGNTNDKKSDICMVATQRNLIASEVSRDLTDRLLLPDRIVKAHNDGVLYFHDKDYFIHSINNCCFVNLKDMLDNGTVINGKLIESPKSFQVACVLVAQIIAAISSNQYGGQAIDICHLGKYLQKTYDKIYNKKIMYYIEKGYSLDESDLLSREDAKERMQEELVSGVQTIKYQINTLVTSNGKIPDVSIFMHIDENDKFLKENVMIIEELLKQTIIGMKDENGNSIYPKIPKLVYVLDQNNCLRGGKFDYITKLAVQCVQKSNLPLFISAKKMKENHNGKLFCPIGENVFLTPWKNEKGRYQYEGRFNQGIVTINLPQIGIIANGDEKKFWKLFEERLQMCKDALIYKHDALIGTLSDISPIHWQYGAISRIKSNEKIDSLLVNGYSTLAVGYLGLYELIKIMFNCDYTTLKGMEFAQKVIQYMNERIDEWNNTSELKFCLYGTNSYEIRKSLLEIDKERFGYIVNVTDKECYEKSFYLSDKVELNIVERLQLENKFQDITNGGTISIIKGLLTESEIEELIRFGSDNIQHFVFIQ